MPILNGVGELIHEREMTKEEFVRVRWLSTIKYPADLYLLVHMKPSTFKEWLYQLSPKEALILSNEEDFKRLREKVLNKNWLVRFSDYLWRLINGTHH